MKKALLFDYGGTLDTDGIHWFEKFFEAYIHLQVPTSKEDLREAFVYAERNCAAIVKPDFDLKKTLKIKIKYQMECLHKNFHLPDVFDSVIDEISEYCYQSVIHNIEIAKEILEFFWGDYSLGLVSNFYGNVETELEELSIKKYFMVILDSAVVGIRKPDTQIYEYALNELGIEPNEAIVIGDSYEKDIKPPKSLGCSTIWINCKGWSESEDTDSADFIIHSMKELPDIVKKIT